MKYYCSKATLWRRFEKYVWLDNRVGVKLHVQGPTFACYITRDDVGDPMLVQELKEMEEIIFKINKCTKEELALYLLEDNRFIREYAEKRLSDDR